MGARQSGASLLSGNGAEERLEQPVFCSATPGFPALMAISTDDFTEVSLSPDCLQAIPLVYHLGDVHFLFTSHVVKLKHHRIVLGTIHTDMMREVIPDIFPGNLTHFDLMSCFSFSSHSRTILWVFDRLRLSLPSVVMDPTHKPSFWEYHTEPSPFIRRRFISSLFLLVANTCSSSVLYQ